MRLIWNAFFNQRKWKRKRKLSIISQLCYCSTRVLSFYWKNILNHIRLKENQAFNIPCIQKVGSVWFYQSSSSTLQVHLWLLHTGLSQSFWNLEQEFDDYLTLVLELVLLFRGPVLWFLSHQFSSNIAAWHEHFRYLQKISTASPFKCLPDTSLSANLGRF